MPIYSAFLVTRIETDFSKYSDISSCPSGSIFKEGVAKERVIHFIHESKAAVYLLIYCSDLTNVNHIQDSNLTKSEMARYISLFICIEDRVKPTCSRDLDPPKAQSVDLLAS